jgi:hypothetical protein
MIYKILADLVVALHFAWILFLFFGAIWGIRNRWVKYLHLTGLGFAFLIQAMDWYCPLTHLEVYFRARHNPSLAYPGSFIIHYLEQAVYLQLPSYAIFMATIFLCGFNLVLYINKR